jgi:hypothetical protein
MPVHVLPLYLCTSVPLDDLDDLDGSPGLGRFGIDAEQEMKMVIHGTETGNGNGEEGV